MARKNQIVCDKCHCTVGKAVEINLSEGREMDPSGNGYVQNTRIVDLCEPCIRKIVCEAVKNGFSI